VGKSDSVIAAIPSAGTSYWGVELHDHATQHRTGGE
jgi:hypothetical protein